MDNLNLYFIFAPGFIVFAAMCFLWVRPLKRSLIQQVDENKTLKPIYARTQNELEWLVSSLKEMNQIFQEPSARKLISIHLTDMDEAGEQCRLSQPADEYWKFFEPVYKEMYQILFERDFQKISSTISIQLLTSMKTRWLDLNTYIEQHPEFKEKCFAILKNELESAECTYRHLEEIADNCELWAPFQLWKEEVDILIQSKAFKLSQNDLFESRQQLSKQFGGVMTIAKAKDIERYFLEVLTIMQRELLTNEAKKDFIRTSESILRNATKVVAVGGTVSAIAKILAELTEKLEETYPLVDINEMEEISS